jgi:hypothetical protein
VSRTYTFRLQGDNGRYDRNTAIELPSVTTIVQATMPKPQLVGWAARQTIDAVVGIVSAHERDLVVDPQALEHFLDTFTDPDMLEEYIQENGLHRDVVLDEASTRGQKAHDLLKTLCSLHAMSPESATSHAVEVLLGRHKADNFQRAVARFWSEKKPVPLLSETVVYNLSLRYAGRLDMVIQGPNGSILIDLKTRRAGLGAYTSDEAQLGGYDLALRDMGLEAPAQRMVLLAYDDGTYDLKEAKLPSDIFVDLVGQYYKTRGAR